MMEKLPVEFSKKFILKGDDSVATFETKVLTSPNFISTRSYYISPNFHYNNTKCQCYNAFVDSESALVISISPTVTDTYPLLHHLILLYQLLIMLLPILMSVCYTSGVCYRHMDVHCHIKCWLHHVIHLLLTVVNVLQSIYRVLRIDVLLQSLKLTKH